MMCLAWALPATPACLVRLVSIFSFCFYIHSGKPPQSFHLEAEVFGLFWSTPFPNRQGKSRKPAIPLVAAALSRRYVGCSM